MCCFVAVIKLYDQGDSQRKRLIGFTDTEGYYGREKAWPWWQVEGTAADHISIYKQEAESVLGVVGGLEPQAGYQQHTSSNRTIPPNPSLIATNWGPII